MGDGASFRLLLAVDFSESSAVALRHAEGLAKRLGAHVVLVHVFVAGEIRLPQGGQTEAEGLPVLALKTPMPRDEAEAWCHRWAEALRTAGLGVTVVLREGVAETAILEAAEADDVDLVMLGRRGLGGIRRALLGSVSRYVADHSRRPVLIVPSFE